MKRQKGNNFADKHEPASQINDRLKDAIMSRTKDNELPCAVAFKIADEQGVSAADVGKTADLTETELVKCQLGLFGYKPDKKIVMPKAPDNPDMVSAIRDSLVGGRLSCEKAWEIARRFDASKMAVSAVCEHLKIKIKPCQLGAF